MPKSEDILTGLKTITTHYQTFAIIWHALFYILIIALLTKWSPSNRLLGILVSLPLMTVAVFAWITGNPFNGLIFTLGAVLILIFGIRSSPDPVIYSELPFVIIGGSMIIFGLVYPHFMEADSFIKYVYASPFGLIPCPTISVLIGLLLIFNGFDAQPIAITFIILGLFYGLFGVLKLAVFLDLYLLVGTLALASKLILELRK